jgi:hypothetical protein
MSRHKNNDNGESESDVIDLGVFANLNLGGNAQQGSTQHRKRKLSPPDSTPIWAIELRFRPRSPKW